MPKSQARATNQKAPDPTAVATPRAWTHAETQLLELALQGARREDGEAHAEVLDRCAAHVLLERIDPQMRSTYIRAKRDWVSARDSIEQFVRDATNSLVASSLDAMIALLDAEAAIGERVEENPAPAKQGGLFTEEECRAQEEQERTAQERARSKLEQAERPLPYSGASHPNY